MKAQMRFRALLTLFVVAASPAAAQTSGQPDPVMVFVERLRDVTARGDRAALDALAATTRPTSPVAEFAAFMYPTPEQLVVKERDRSPLDDGGQRLLLEIFSAVGNEARVGTWQADVGPVDRAAASDPASWRILRMERLSVATGLLRLSLDPSRQFTVRHLTVKAPDLSIELPAGSAFLASAPNGPTAVVLLGRGRMHFTPPDPAECTQVRIFSGAEQLDAEFDVALIRVRPDDFESFFPAGTLTPGAPNPGDLRRASEYFEDNVGRSLRLDLNDLSRDRWSLVPQYGDLIAEIRTRKFGNLTYARVGSEPKTSPSSIAGDARTSRSTPRRRSSRCGDASTARTISSTTTSSTTTSRRSSARSACGSTAARG